VGKVAFGGRTTDAMIVNTAAFVGTTIIVIESRTVPVHALVAFARSSRLPVRMTVGAVALRLRWTKLGLTDWDLVLGQPT
jgi:hypothetical protein